MLRGPIRVLLGLVDRAARAWVRWRGGAVPSASVGDGPMQNSQPPADWVERVRRGAPGLLDPADDDHVQLAPAAPDSRPKEMGELPQPPRIVPAGDPKPASPSATPRPPATPRPSRFEVAPPRRPRGTRPAAGDSGQSPASRGEGVGPPAADVLLPGRPHPSQQQPTAPESAKILLVGLEPSATPLRPPAPTKPPAADSKSVVSRRKSEAPSPVQHFPTQVSAPISTEAAPRSIDRSHSAAGQPARSATARAPSERLAEERSDSDSHSWLDLPDPPEEAGTDVEVALRKMERDRQVAREHSRL